MNGPSVTRVERTEYRAVGDYSGSQTTSPPVEDRAAAWYAAGSMTMADRTWVETRRVVVETTDWERADACAAVPRKEQP